MPVIQLREQSHPLSQGQTRLGSGPDADISVSENESLGVQAVLDLDASGQVVIRRVAEMGVVRVNGVALGAEPTPLMHGDKVEVGGVELLLADDKKGGATQYVSASDVASMTAKRTGPARATAATGGRLVSLVDGKEYAVPGEGLTIGREAGNDVVVAQSEVSRKHAILAATETGYVVTDHSVNGLFVNGERVEGSRLLARADVLRVGTEEFRFYADVPAVSRPSAAAPTPVAPAAAVPATPAQPARPVPPRPSQPVPMPPPMPITQEPLGAIVTTPPKAPDTRPVLATLEFTGSTMLGEIAEVRGPATSIGRGAHNDIVIADRSVSDSHAKLQLRDDGWYLEDAESTNGTFVGSSRIKVERRLDGSPDVRFGSVTAKFRPLAEESEPAAPRVSTPVAAPVEAKPAEPVASRVSAPVPPVASAAPRASASHAARVSASAHAPEPEVEAVESAPAAKPRKRGASVWLWILLVLVVLGAAVYYLRPDLLTYVQQYFKKG